MLRDFDIVRITRFYLPLLLQAFTQSLTYPLVAGIVTHGVYGVNALTAFTQGQLIMFMIGAIGCGLPMTGLVFARTFRGYHEFCKLNTAMMIVLVVMQLIASLPPFDGLIFEDVFALPPDLALLACRIMRLSVFMNIAFFLRNVSLSVLLNNLQSGKAIIATFARMILTLFLAWLLPIFSLTGPFWGLFALTCGCILETFMTWLFARKLVIGLYRNPTVEENVSFLHQLRFTMPLSLGGFLLMISPLLVAGFIGRTENPADMLVVHYVTIAIANPVSFAALRMQAVAIEFPPADERDHRLLYYSIVAGILLGLIPFAFSLPVIGDWYFGVYQNVPTRIVGTAETVMAIYSFVPVVHAIRGRVEGIAALRKCSIAVMSGQIFYMLGILLILFALSFFRIPGWAMAQTSIIIAPVLSSMVIYIVLHLRR